MKKIYIVLVLLFGLILVGCTPTSSELPPLNESDALDLTMEEKYEMMQQINFDDVEESGFRLDQFMKLDFAYESESDFTSEMYSMNQTSNGLLNVDYDASFYASLGASANDTVLYAGINKAIINATMESNLSQTGSGEDPLDQSSKDNYALNITDSFLLLMDKIAYLKTNGSLLIENYVDDELMLETKVDESFANIKEKSMMPVFTDEAYLEIKNQIAEMKSSVELLPEDMPTDAELDELMEELDAMVTVYQTGDVYTLRILVNKMMIDTLIDQTFEMIMLQIEAATADQINSMTTLKALIKNALKSFEFDFRIEVKGPEDGVKNLSKISLSVNGEFTGFTFDMAEFDEQAMPLRIDFGVTVEKFGFILDFNGAEPEFPTEAELAAYEAVETPSIVELLDPERQMFV